MPESKYVLLVSKQSEVDHRICEASEYDHMDPQTQQDYIKYTVINTPPKYDIYNEVLICKDLKKTLSLRSNIEMEAFVNWEIIPIPEETKRQRVNQHMFNLIQQVAQGHQESMLKFIFMDPDNKSKKDIYECQIDFKDIVLLNIQNQLILPVVIPVFKFEAKDNSDFIENTEADILRIPTTFILTDHNFKDILFQYNTQKYLCFKNMTSALVDNSIATYEQLIIIKQAQSK